MNGICLKLVKDTGARANRNGVPRDDNPHATKECRDAWFTGWDRSCKQQSASPTFGQRNFPFEM